MVLPVIDTAIGDICIEFAYYLNTTKARIYLKATKRTADPPRKPLRTWELRGNHGDSWKWTSLTVRGFHKIEVREHHNTYNIYVC